MPDAWHDEIFRDTEVAFPEHTFPGMQAKHSESDEAPGIFLKVPSGQGVGRIVPEGQ